MTDWWLIAFGGMSVLALGMRIGPIAYDFAERQRYYDFDELAREVAETLNG